MKRKVVLLGILFLSLCLYGQEAEEEKSSEKYELQYIEAKKFVDALPEGLKKNKIYILTDRNGFVIRCGEKEKKVVEEYIRILDEEPKATAVRLKYLSTEELLRNLPPSVNKESITVTSNPNILFFNGSEGRKEQFLKELELIDKPKAQIRYQLLVVQYEKSEDMNWTKSLEVKKSNGAPMSEFSGVMSNIFNINFDIVSKFDYQFIAKLSFELSENKARVLADTTLNGLTGEEVKFQNTNTFRYIDKTLDANGKPLYGSMREITSGLLLNIKGNVSGDEMITMEVNAQVSKQGSGGVTSGVLPPTSEKIVKTKVRTQSGTPIIIGGLLQAERNSSEKKVPGLGDIPIAGMLFKDTSGAETVTEMVIYIVPYLHREKEKKEKKSERLMRLYKKYVEEAN